MTRRSRADVPGILQEHGAVLEGHFRLPSGLHTAQFVQPALVFQFPHLGQKIAKALSDLFPGEVDVVVSSGMGGVVVAQEVARVRRSRSIYFERAGGAMGLRQHFHLDRGERVLIVEDVLMGGWTTRELVSVAKGLGAKVAGVASVVDRSTEPLKIGVPVRSLVTLPIKVAPPDECAQCQRKVPIEIPDEGGRSVPRRRG